MRIVHVDSARGWRGGQNQVLLTAAGMARLGHEVWLACQGGSPLEARARAAGLEVRAMAFHGDLSPGPILGLARLIREARPEVVHMHDPHAISCGLAAGLGQRFRSVASRRVDFHIDGPLSRWKYRACGRVVAVSRAVAQVLGRAGLRPERMRVVYEGVPDRPPMPGGHDALQALGIPPGAPVVGNVAALTDHKDHATLLAAAARVAVRRPEVRFVVVGDGELRAALESRRRELGLSDVVLFTGYRDDVDRLLPAFDVFCLSSQMEGLGTSVLDAMAFVRPVVATRAGGIPEAVEDGITGRLVAPRDPEALAEALLEVLSDPARGEALGTAGRRRFEERFTAERMVKETLRVYEEHAGLTP